MGIFYGYDYGSVKKQVTYSNSYSSRPFSIAAWDFNNDSYIDIATTFAGNSDGTFNELIMYSVAYHSYPSEIISVDVNNDYILDIIVANSGSDSLGVLLGYANGTFAPVVTYPAEDSSCPQSVGVGDFSNDNVQDIVIVNFRRDNIGLLIGIGDGTFQSEVTFSTDCRSMPTFITVSDIDNDHNSDVGVSNENTDNIDILYGYGNGSFALLVFYPTGDGSSPYCIRSADFNNDPL